MGLFFVSPPFPYEYEHWSSFHSIKLITTFFLDCSTDIRSEL
jgi:hypothetical protein